MAIRTSSWLREALGLYVRYLIAGVATIPFAAIYAYLSLKHLDRPWVLAILLVAGLVSAFLAWNYYERRFLSKVQPVAINVLAADCNAEGTGFGLIVASAVMTTSFAIICIQQLRPVPPNRGTLIGGAAQVLSSIPSLLESPR